jgi:trehalose synthase
MLQLVDVAPQDLASYEKVAGEAAIEELRQLARPLRGARIAHVNATSYGGGVSELLRSLVPLYRALDCEADWKVLGAETAFFEVTKGIHNALQGAPFELTSERRSLYLETNEVIARDLEDGGYDYVIVHDPQPAALRTIHGKDGGRWVWRCHIDTSEPDAGVLAFLEPFLRDYDALVFTMPEFVPPSLHDLNAFIIPPAIDPLSPKNMDAPADLCRQIVRWAGVHIDQNLITQVSRFDPWKDPMGVIAVYRRVREEVPGTQLALVGQMALDDPEGWDMYHAIVSEASGDPDIHVLTNFTGAGNIEVNAFQATSNVVLQKSIREGFGLVVSEAMWKGTPVVAARAGGIPLQMAGGAGGYLVDSDDECVARTVHLLQNPQEAKDLGASGRARVRENFLITRLLADELRLLNTLS